MLDGRAEAAEWMDDGWMDWGRGEQRGEGRGGEGHERGGGGGEEEEKKKEVEEVEGAGGSVISSRSLPSAAVVRWLAGRPGGPRACAGPPTRRR